MTSSKYFNAPVFNSRKSSYTLRWRNKFERNLMALFDTNSEVVDYFQPLMEIVVDECYEGNTTVNIDFWLECQNDKTILVHIPTKALPINDIQFEQARVFCRRNNFGFLVLRPAESPVNDTFQARLF